ncbi:MAG: penicillin-binding protein activator [Rhodospirillales bacterium]
MTAWPCRCRLHDVVPWLAIAALVMSACDTLPSRRAAQPPLPPPAAPEPPADAVRPQPPAAIVLDTLPPPSETDAVDPLVALTPPALPPPSLGTVRVALMVPLSGRHAELGEAMLNAAQLALFDVADRRFELLPYDTGGSPEGAAQAIRSAVGDGATLVLGPLLAASVRAAAPAAWAAGVPVIAFSSDRSVAGDGVYVMGFAPQIEIERVVAYAVAQGAFRLALLAPDDAYGAAAITALEEVAAVRGAVVTRAEFYDPAAGDFNEVVRRLVDPTQPDRGPIGAAAPLATSGPGGGVTLARAGTGQRQAWLPFDAVLVADGGRRLQAVAAHLPVHGIDPGTVRVLGTGAWDEPGLGAEPALLGGWFAAPQPDFRAGFEEQYVAAYGRAPARLATLAYDATALAALLAQSPADGGFDEQALTDPRGFAGRDGIFRFRADGAAERGLAVLEVERRGARVVSEAPTSFERQ